ncbi:hypothetical protein [Streptomyces sp. ODS28]|uniref:hypothetical protein n=1 Tax=Streptomyces sp. ODS28 TaxID=3136688 RepID=UPI0031E77FF7
MTSAPGSTSAPDPAPDPTPGPAPLLAAPSAVFLRRMTRWQADQWREELADLSLAAYSPRGLTLFDHRPGFLVRLERHLLTSGFALVIAQNAEPAGCCYGVPACREGAWWEGFAGPLPHELEMLTALGRVFEVAELMVLPEYRRAGLALRMLDMLLAETAAAVAVARVPHDDVVAREVWRAARWTRLGRFREAGGAPSDEVYVRRLRER